MGVGVSGGTGQGNLQEFFYLLQDLSPRGEDHTHPRSYVALDQRTKTEVALVIPEGTADGKEELFTSQVQRARSLAGPQFPRMLEGGKVGLRYYAAFEWIDGAPLRTLLDCERLSPELAMYLLRKMTESLSQFHSNGFVHGDIHPRNVLVDPQGEVHLVGFLPAPFGRPLTTTSPDATLRRYASPEFLESGKVDQIGDVYSLGLLAYELFTGRPLLPRGSAARTRRNQVEIQKALERVARVTRSVPIELSNVLRSMIQVEREKRPRYGLELIGALDAAMPPQGDASLARTQLKTLLRQALRRTAKALLGDAHTYLEARQPLPAASCLHRAARLSETLNEGDQEVLSELLRRTMWRSFPARDSELDASSERVYREALLLQLHRASLHSGDERLQVLSGFRLEQVMEEDSPPVHSLPTTEDLGYLQALKPRLIRRLLSDKASAEELLTLASMTQDFRPHVDASLQVIKGSLVRCFQSHSSPDADASSQADSLGPWDRTPLPGRAGARKPQTNPPAPRPEEKPFRPVHIPSQAETLSEVFGASWVGASDPDILVDIVLDAVEEAGKTREQEAQARKLEKEEEEESIGFGGSPTIHL